MRLGRPQACRPGEAGPEAGLDAEPLAHVHPPPGSAGTRHPASRERCVEKGSEGTAAPLGMDGLPEAVARGALVKVQPGWGQVRGGPGVLGRWAVMITAALWGIYTPLLCVGC